MARLGDFRAEQIVYIEPPVTRARLIDLVHGVVDQFSGELGEEEFFIEPVFDPRAISRFGKSSPIPHNDIEIVPYTSAWDGMIGSIAVRSADWGRWSRSADTHDAELTQSRAVITFASDLTDHINHADAMLNKQ